MSEQPQNQTTPPETMDWVPDARQTREIDEDCKRVEQILGTPPVPPRVEACTLEERAAMSEWARKRLREITYLIPRTRFPRVMIRTSEERDAVTKAMGERAARMFAERERKREEAIDWAITRVKELTTACRNHQHGQSSRLPKP